MRRREGAWGSVREEGGVRWWGMCEGREGSIGGNGGTDAQKREGRGREMVRNEDGGRREMDVGVRNERRYD